MKKYNAYYFSSKEETLGYGDGRKAEVGITHDVEGKIILCKNGLHGSERLIDALKYAPGNILWGVEIWGDVEMDIDKLAGRYRKYLWRLDCAEILRVLARKCALDVIHLWDHPEKEVAVQFLKTGDESLRDAAYAAYTTYAADSAAYAAYYAAYAAYAADSAAYAARSVARSVHSAAYAAYYAADAADAADSAAYAAYYAADAADAADAAYSETRIKQNRRLVAMVTAARKKQK